MMKYIKYLFILSTLLLSSCSIFHPTDPFTGEVDVESMDIRFFLFPVLIIGYAIILCPYGLFYNYFKRDMNLFTNPEAYEEAAYIVARLICYGTAFFVYNIILYYILASYGECNIFLDLAIFASTVGLTHLGVKKYNWDSQPWLISIAKVIVYLSLIAAVGVIIYLLYLLGKNV